MTKEEIIEAITRLSTAERRDIFAEFCTHCGDSNPRCQCTNEE